MAIAYGVPCCLTVERRSFLEDLMGVRVKNTLWPVWVNSKSEVKTSNGFWSFVGFNANWA
jgi:hypothetical protein